ncbi:MAG: NUDIX domain-containing protein [Burkholderiales bacterium]|nr:NUDIX domain-containing protein [Burkholderiales bacterium]
MINDRLITHLTVAAIIEYNNKFLLVQDKTHLGLKLNQPAGHVEPNENIVNAIMCEVKEETGLIFIPQKLVGIYYFQLEQKTFLRMCFKGAVSGNIDNPTPNINEKNVVTASWYSMDEIKQRNNEHRSFIVQKCFDDYLANNEFDLSILH